MISNEKVRERSRLGFASFLRLAPALAVIFLSGVCWAPSAGAQPSVSRLTGKTVDQIEVRGLKRIEREAVVEKLITRQGEPLSREKVAADIRALFEMGYFDDIEVRAEPDGARVDLTYVLRERPVISEIEFEGNERISTDDLKDVTRIREWSILDINQVKEDVARIQKHYEEKGFYLAKIDFEIVPAGKEEVKLVFKVRDFEKVKIKRIRFLNNRKFSDSKLRGIFQETSEEGVLSALSGSGSFKETSFKQDLQRLTYWYLDNGYVKFRYENPIVSVTDDKKWLYVTIYVEEGEQYRMDEIGFGGDLLFPKEELQGLLTLTSGEVFSISKRNLDIQKLTEKYQDLGYAFVNVIPKMNIKDEAPEGAADASKTIEMQYDFEKGNLVHFGDIRIIGNTKTHDKVVRRELRINEGELYSGSKLRQSRENVERLGYFAPGEVVFNTITRKDNPDVVDVEITVKERSTGTVTLGAGYGSQQGFFLTGQVSEINLFGRGQTINLTGQYATDKLSQSLNLGFTDPYAFDTRWSAGFDLFYVRFPIPNKYDTRRRGFNLRAGYPIYDFTHLFATYKFEGMNIIDADEGIDQAEIAADEGLLSSVVLSLIRDKRNNRFETTGGNYQSVSLETAGLGGDKEFVKYTLNNRFYTRVAGDLVFRNSFEFGQIFDLSGDRIPPSERFYLGGPNNLRGYNIFSVGPDRRRNIGDVDGDGDDEFVNEPLGGAVQFFGLFELEYPLIREAGLKFLVFYDIGNVFSGFPDLENLTLRSDAGFGFRWFSPIGPLRFEFGYPFRRQAGEDNMVFNFFIGTPF